MLMSHCSRHGLHPRGQRCPRCPAKGGTHTHRLVRAQVLAEETLCWLCGEEGTEEDPLTLDHVIARSLGGETTRRNGRAAHGSCNSRRGQVLT